MRCRLLLLYGIERYCTAKGAAARQRVLLYGTGRGCYCLLSTVRSSVLLYGKGCYGSIEVLLYGKGCCRIVNGVTVR